MILEAIEKDDQSEVFEALLVDVRNCMTELQRTGQLNAMSITLQDDAAIFFAQRRDMSDSGSKKALQKIVNILKKQETAGAANDTMIDQSQNSDSMGLGSSATPSEPPSRPPPTWAQLKTMILESIKKDALPKVFEALLVDVRNCMIELQRTG